MINAKVQYRKSWVAYVAPAVGLFLVIVFGGTVVASTFSMTDAKGGVPILAAVAVLLLWLALLAIIVARILTIRSVLLYADDAGVWLSQGIFPWSKGTRGVKWRDIEDAVFYQGFFGWILKSYRVRVGHRFTKTSEIVVTHVALGNEAVMAINSLHQGLIGPAVAEEG